MSLTATSAAPQHGEGVQGILGGVNGPGKPWMSPSMGMGDCKALGNGQVARAGRGGKE